MCPVNICRWKCHESGHDMNQEMLSETSNKIRKANIRVVLDHFGAKNSSVAILSIMEFDGLKLDKSLVTNIVGNGRCQIVAQAVIQICRRLGISVQQPELRRRIS